MGLITIDTQKLKDLQNAKAKSSRLKAFKDELDPLTMKAARGEVTQAELLAKAAEIRGRFPYIA